MNEKEIKTEIENEKSMIEKMQSEIKCIQERATQLSTSILLRQGRISIRQEDLTKILKEKNKETPKK